MAQADRNSHARGVDRSAPALALEIERMMMLKIASSPPAMRVSLVSSLVHISGDSVIPVGFSVSGFASTAESADLDGELAEVAAQVLGLDDGKGGGSARMDTPRAMYPIHAELIADW